MLKKLTGGNKWETVLSFNPACRHQADLNGYLAPTWLWYGEISIWILHRNLGMLKLENIPL